jgi:CheY-like chemotaxis protein
VIANLVINARDALEGGGRIELATEVVGGEVLLRVRDDGHGMDEATLAQAFDPFFTTKPAGAGTGLGLATVLGIVAQSGGRVDVESAPGAGTLFEIALPLVAATAPDTPPPAEPQLRAANGTVLLVEDEAVVRDLLAQVLADAGFDVLVAADGEEALALARDAGAIDLLLTDVVMPKMSGRELAERFQSARPETKILYTSGYTDGAIGDQGVLEPGTEFIQKPFSFADLTQKVRSVLDSTPA